MPDDKARHSNANRSAEETYNELMNGSLLSLRQRLLEDQAFAGLVEGHVDAGEDADPSILVGAPNGIRPALAAASADRKPVVIVVPSGREAEDLVGDLRSWYDGDPNEVAQLMAWETLPHERLSPRADTVANRMETFYRLCHPQSDSEMFGPIRILVMPVRSLIQPVVAGIGDVKPLVSRKVRKSPLKMPCRASSAMPKNRSRRASVDEISRQSFCRTMGRTPNTASIFSCWASSCAESAASARTRAMQTGTASAAMASGSRHWKKDRNISVPISRYSSSCG